MLRRPWSKEDLVQAKFKRAFGSLEGIFALIQEFFLKEGLNSRHFHTICLAAEELFTNMVKYNQGHENEILICLWKADDRLCMSLTDFEVDPFDITQAPPASEDMPLQDRQPGGLGIHLVRQMMDDITYEYENRQSRITVAKDLG
jgi:serine/threonine-protein kinase RsbW